MEKCHARIRVRHRLRANNSSTRMMAYTSSSPKRRAEKIHTCRNPSRGQISRDKWAQQGKGDLPPVFCRPSRSEDEFAPCKTLINPVNYSASRRSPTLFATMERAFKLVSNQPLPATVTTLSSPAGAAGNVAILLCTYNGGRFLRQQLDSIAAQTHPHWTVYASDDGSTDETLEILQQYREAWGSQRLKISRGPERGFSVNFLSVLAQACGGHMYYAFCDQDDIWHPTKLQNALEWQRCQPADIPTLYCGRTRIIDTTGRAIGFSPLFSKRPSFENALMQSLAGGNTMLINQAACSLLVETPTDAQPVCHDWWAYLLISGCGGNVYYDPVPTLDYRQHAQNVIGANTSLMSRVSRLTSMLKGSLQDWNNTNIAALNHLQKRLTAHNLSSLQRFEQARNAPLATRIKLMLQSRFYRQTLLGNLGLVMAVLFRKI